MDARNAAEFYNSPSLHRPVGSSSRGVLLCTTASRSMQIPSIAPGKRFTLPRPIGSADAMLLARFASEQAANKKLTAIVTAEPADTQRLEGELAFFASQLRIAV